jgi:hypothetical protein
MTEPVRSVAAVEARQGGFSTLQLPAPVQYAGAAGADELIVYWTETGPAATAGNVSWTSTNFGSGYTTTTFQGQLAARAIASGFGAGMLHRGLIDEEVFSIGTEDFTHEWWGNPGAAGNNEFVFADIISDNASASVTLSGFESFTVRKWDEFAGFQGGVEDLAYGEDIGSTSPGWTHICLQRQGNLCIYHRDGQRIQFNFKNGFSSNDQTLSVVDMSGNFTIEAFPFAASGTDVAIGQIRITKGSARYGTDNFTPPTEAFYVP